MAIDNATLSHLRGRIAALEGTALGPALEGRSTGEDHGVIPFGLATIDDHLPAGGLAGGCVHEITDGSNSGSATAFAAALAGRAQRLHRPPVVWIAPRIDQRESLYGPGLAAVDLTASRRLQLAAEAGGTFGLLLRSPLQSSANNGDNSAIPPAIPPIASVTRWRVTAAPSGPAWPPPLLGATRWQVELLRARGGRPHHWLLEWQHDPTDETAGGFALATASGDRSAVPTVPNGGGPPPERVLPPVRPPARPLARPLAHTG